MIASKDSVTPHSSDALPASKKVYVTKTVKSNCRDTEIRVPFREIAVTDTKKI